MSKVQAVARVQILMEFPVVGQIWNADAPVEQVHRQAAEAALDILRRGLIIEGATQGPGPISTKTPAEVIGEPVITAILVQKQS